MAESSEIGPMLLPEKLLEAMRDINGYDPKLIIRRKQLYKCDVEKQHSRLLLPLKQLEDSDILTEDQKKVISEKQMRTRPNGLSVAVVDPRLEVHDLELHRWPKNYALVKGWNKIVDDNKFKVNDVFSLWGFRYGGGSVVAGSGLCFALIRAAKDKDDDAVDSSESFFDDSLEEAIYDDALFDAYLEDGSHLLQSLTDLKDIDFTPLPDVGSLERFFEDDASFTLLVEESLD